MSNSFEAINDSGDIVVINQSNVFYYIGQATYQSQIAGNNGGWVYTYFISTSTKPMCFVELVPSAKTTLLDMRVVSGGYSVRAMSMVNTIPRIFCFTQSPVSSIGNPSDYSMVLYDEAGNITFDGSRDLLYTPCLANYTTAGTTVTGNKLNTIRMNDTLTLSLQGTLPSSVAAFMPAVSFKVIYAFDPTNAWYVVSSPYAGMILDSGVIKSCWVSFSSGSTFGIPFLDSANVGLTCQVPMINISRYA